ncbi:hypothetical protein GCK32_008366 [Trichostrongylus colubriformis]|uniref:Uncharacterized protein n=1 Tax=Trichostrongylus colubriformis TaxID=6319 RepID=A0AAN8FQV7_TRICO
MRRTCTICGCVANEKTMKKSNKNKKLNVILTASLSLIGSVNRTNVGRLAEEFTSRAKHYCHSHVVEAAQYLSADVLSTGKHFSYYKDPSAGGIVAYFITTDIPSHLVGVINDMCDNSVQITDRDVLSFINAALKKHYGTSMWSRHYAEEERFEETEVNTEEAESDFEAFTQIPEASDCEPSCSDSESVLQSGCKMRRTCVLCGRFANAKTMIRNNRNKKMGLILTASLSLIGCVEKAKVDRVVERISNRIKYFCRSHVVQAARYLTAEVLATGTQFSYYKDPSASGPTAYFNTADIPLHIVNVINGMSKNGTAITARDVFSFINGALKKYYGTRLWHDHHKEEEDLEDGTLDADTGDSAVDGDSKPLLAFEDNTQSDGGMVHDFEGSDDEMSGSSSRDSEDVSLTGCKMRRTCVFCGRYDSATTMKQTIRNKKLNFILTSSLSLIGCVDSSNVDRVTEHFSNRNKYFCRSHVVEAAQYLCAEVLATGKRFSYYNDPSARGIAAYFNTTDIPSHLIEVINGMSKNAGPITGRDVLSFINTALKKYYGTHLWSRHYEEENTGEAVPDADAGDSVASSNSEVLSDTQEVQNDEETAVESEAGDDGASSLTAKMPLYGLYGGDAEEYSLTGRKMRRTCVFCGRISSVKTMKQTLRNKKLTLILTSSLSMIGCVNRADVANMVDEFSNHVKHFCRSHVVEAVR